MEEERAAALIHELYPLSFPHPFGSKVDARPQSSTRMRDTRTPVLPCVFISAAAGGDKTPEPALLGREASFWK